MTTTGVRIGDVAAVNPRDAAWAKIPDDAIVTFVPMSAVSASSGSIEEPSLRSAGEVKKGFTRFREGDVLVAKISPSMENGKIARATGLANGLGAGTTEFHVLRPTKQISTDYLYHALKRDEFRRAAAKALVGVVGQKRVPKEFLEDYRIPLPSLDEQHQIARLLNALDELQRARTEARFKMQRVVPALFVEMFGDPIANPMGWDVVPVRSFVARFQAGKSLPEAVDSQPSAFRVLKVSSVSGGQFVPTESKSIDSAYVPPAAHFVRAGDLLLSRASGSADLVGMTALVERPVDGLLLSDKLWRFVLREGVDIEKRWLLALFQHPSIRAELTHQSSGMSMRNIPMRRVLDMPVPFPPIEAQRRFATMAAATKDATSAQQCGSELLASAERTLRSKLFAT